VRDEFDSSASDNLIALSLPILFPVVSEHEMKQRGVTAEIECSERRI
jgi:hypothetical protein